MPWQGFGSGELGLHFGAVSEKVDSVGPQLPPRSYGWRGRDTLGNLT